MRDTSVSRNYYGLKLACWLSYGSYWTNTLTQNQAFNLVERTLNNPEIDARWPSLQEIDIKFPQKGTTAWAERNRNGRGVISLPPGTLSPLVVLHEIAHLLPTTKKEADHGPGFMAIHLMLVELMAPKSLPSLVAAYHATHARYDFSLIPEPAAPSNYLPIVAGAPSRAALTQMKALLSSGRLSEKEKQHTRSAIRKLERKVTDDETPLQNLPRDIRIPTGALLRCNTPEQIANLVLEEIRSELMPKRMRRETSRKNQR